MNKMKLISHYDGYGNKDMYDANSEVYAITDDFVMKNEYKNIPKEKKIAMLIEPRAIQPNVYEYMEKHYDEFKYVFCGDDKLLDALPNAKPILWGWVWYDCEFPEKNKLMCMISSDKELCDLHKARKNVARKYKDKIDVYGTIDDGKYVEENVHEPYKYEVVIENDIEDRWFTEKILNCFANKTIPIYYGARKINEYFNHQGILMCNSIEEVEHTIEDILERQDEYDFFYEWVDNKKILDENYKLSKQYKSFDDWFYKNYKKEIEEMFK